MSVFKLSRRRRREAVGEVRRGLKFKLRLAGYSKEQVDNLVGSIGDGQIWEKMKELWTTWGPTILKIIAFLLPLLLAKEKPSGLPVDTLGVDEIAKLDAEYTAFIDAESLDPLYAETEPDPAGRRVGSTPTAGDGGRDMKESCQFCGAAPGEPCGLQPDVKAKSVGHMIRYTRHDVAGKFVIGPFVSRWNADQAVMRLIKAAGAGLKDVVVYPALLPEVAELVVGMMV